MATRPRGESLFDSQAAQFEHPHAESVSAGVACHPSDLAELVTQSVQCGLREACALAQVAEAEHLLTAVEGFHDRCDASENGAFRISSVVAPRNLTADDRVTGSVQGPLGRFYLKSGGNQFQV
ncbi:hypothetical protein GCM10020255_000590 [Rhodococcus baikonurensis]